MANNTTSPEQEFLNAENEADKKAQVFEANNTHKPEGACEHIRKHPHIDGWYCNLTTYGTPICDKCSRNTNINTTTGV